MRHAIFGRKLGRDISARKALLNNLASSLIVNGQLETTETKAKFVRPYVEKVITLAKRNRLGTQRVIASTLEKGAFDRLFLEIAPGFSERSGGYTRIVKMGPRRGDSAKMARIELVEWDKSKAKQKQIKAKVKKVARSKAQNVATKATTKKVETKSPKPKSKPTAKSKKPVKKSVKS